MSTAPVRRLCLTGTLLGAAAALPFPAPTQAAPPGDLSPVLQPLLERSGLPALGAAVVTRDGLEAIGTVDDALWEKMLARGGTTRSGFGAPGTPGKLDQPLGHTKGDGVHGDPRWVLVKLGNGDDNPGTTGPAGTLVKP